MAFVVDAGKRADCTDDGGGGDMDTVDFLDQLFEGEASVLASRDVEPCGAGMAVNGVNAINLEGLTDHGRAGPVNEEFFDALDFGMATDGAFAGVAGERGVGIAAGDDFEAGGVGDASARSFLGVCRGEGALLFNFGAGGVPRFVFDGAVALGDGACVALGAFVVEDFGEFWSDAENGMVLLGCARHDWCISFGWVKLGRLTRLRQGFGEARNPINAKRPPNGGPALLFQTVWLALQPRHASVSRSYGDVKENRGHNNRPPRESLYEIGPLTKQWPPYIAVPKEKRVDRHTKLCTIIRVEWRSSALLLGLALTATACRNRASASLGRSRPQDFNMEIPMFDGLEIDMLSLGDADCVLVTQWADSRGWRPQRVLIDGGTKDDSKAAREFLRSRGVTELWAVVCTHLHNDHAAGLIELVRDGSLTIHAGWMHDVRNHISRDTLRRASADAVRQILETTEELASAFASRRIVPREPFAGDWIAGIPSMVVLGPSQPFYKATLREFVGVGTSPAALPAPYFAGLLSTRVDPRFTTLSSLMGDANRLGSGLGALSPLFAGALSNSSVKKSPSTQPFNNTSTILGMNFNNDRLLLTADAGSDALDRVPGDWRNVSWMQVPHHGSDGNLSRDNIERFCPKTAYVSASGDSSHPSRAIVNGLIKVRSTVYSTHTSGHLWHYRGTVPRRDSYGPAVPLKGQSDPILPTLYSDLYGATR